MASWYLGSPHRAPIAIGSISFGIGKLRRLPIDIRPGLLTRALSPCIQHQATVALRMSKHRFPMSDNGYMTVCCWGGTIDWSNSRRTFTSIDIQRCKILWKRWPVGSSGRRPCAGACRCLDFTGRKSVGLAGCMCVVCWRWVGIQLYSVVCAQALNPATRCK